MDERPRRAGEAPPGPGPSRSRLFQGEASRSNALLARTLYNELCRSGKTRAEILDFVNVLLGLVVASPSRAPQAAQLIDPQTGLPTKRGIHQLLMHESDPEAEHPNPSGVFLILLPPDVDGLLIAHQIRHTLRTSDVVGVVGEHLLAVVVYPKRPEDFDRVRERLSERLNAVGPGFALAGSLLPSPQPLRILWGRLLRELTQGLTGPHPRRANMK